MRLGGKEHRWRGTDKAVKRREGGAGLKSEENEVKRCDAL